MDNKITKEEKVYYVKRIEELNSEYERKSTQQIMSFVLACVLLIDVLVKPNVVNRNIAYFVDFFSIYCYIIQSNISKNIDKIEEKLKGLEEKEKIEQEPKELGETEEMEGKTK